MPTKKDLLEAQSFSRRRLLTAFTSGAPGGKELEPATPLRAVIAGAALAIMVIIGGAFYGLVRPGLPDGWENNKVVLVSDTGARYLSINGTLYPVINATSARLLLPASEYDVISATATSLEDIPVGPAIGILGAPDDVPTQDNLIADGWTACPTPDGTAVSLPGEATPAGAAQATVVTSGTESYVIAGRYRYPLGSDSDQVLRQIGLAGVVPIEVESRWLNLFELGTPLAPLVIQGADQGLLVGSTDLPIGAVVHPQGSTNLFVVTADQRLASLSPIAYQLYLLGTGAKLGGEREVIPSDIASLPNDPTPAGASDWPTEAITPLDLSLSLCALLDRDATGAAETVLATSTTAPQGAGVDLEAHTGALVFASGRGGSPLGSLALIDDSGTAFPLPDADAEVLARLGYTAEDAARVPLVWTQFFASGPSLTVAAAGLSPTESDASLPSATPTASQESVTTEATASAQASGIGADADTTGLFAADGEGDSCEIGVVVYSTQTPESLTLLQSEASWQKAKGRDVVVAVVDSGIDATNVHLRDAVIGGINLVPDGEAADGTTDLFGHGTAVAGVIAAREYAPDSAVLGLAPEAQLLSVRVYRGDDEESVEAGYGPDAGRVAQGIVWAVDNGADIVNVSMSDNQPSTALEQAVAYAVAHKVLVVASAGNRGTATNTADSPRYPAAYDGVLAVAGAGSDGNVTESSIHGKHVDVSAPGQNIITATTGGGDCTYAADAASSSYATGYATAAAALVAQAFPQEGPAQWVYRLEASALRDSPDNRDDREGWGLIQPYDALTFEPGVDERGPSNPEYAVAALSVEPQVAAVDVLPAQSVWERTRGVATVAALLGAVVIAGLSVLAAARRRPETGDRSAGRKGLLDHQREAATRLRS